MLHANKTNSLTLFNSVGLLLFLLLASCKTATVTSINPEPLFHDDLFPDYQQLLVESEQEVFAIGKDVTNFVDKKLKNIDKPEEQIEAFAEAIFHHSDLNLLYQNDANTVASATFKNRAANCLSLTIMTYAMADYAGFGVRFQQVDTPELWVRREGSSVLNRHVNLRLFAKTQDNVIIYSSKQYQLDFDREIQSLRLPVKLINKKRVLAMFYNNKGAEALLKEDYQRAYSYFRASLVTAPTLIEALSNFGVLYSRIGEQEYAEKIYQQALELDEDDYTILENLAYTYKMTGREQDAEQISQRVDRLRQGNPYYHFMLGEVAYEKQQWQQAIDHFKQSVRLNKNQHEFYFSIARSYYKLGDVEQAKLYLVRAKKHTQDDNSEHLYQSKIDRLTDLQ